MKHYYYTYLIKKKEEAPQIFKYYKYEVKNQLDKIIKIIISDKVEEYETPFGEFCL